MAGQTSRVRSISYAPLVGPSSNARSIESLSTLEALAAFEPLGEPLFSPLQSLYAPSQRHLSVASIIQLLRQGHVPHTGTLKFLKFGIQTIVRSLQLLNEL